MDSMQHTQRILDAYYQKSYPSKIASESKHLSHENKGMLYNVLTKYEFLFGRTLGTWKMKPVDMGL